LSGGFPEFYPKGEAEPRIGKLSSVSPIAIVLTSFTFLERPVIHNKFDDFQNILNLRNISPKYLFIFLSHVIGTHHSN
jgi:hypothetical protein